jgi:hypothetical protein
MEMKGLYAVLLIGLLMGTLFNMPVTATSPGAITGIVKNENTGQPLQTEICFKELTTNQMVYKNSNQDGTYTINLNEFTNGWAYGDTVQISTVLLSFIPYMTTKYLHQDWGSATYFVEMDLSPRVPDQTVTKPWGPDADNVDLLDHHQINGKNAGLTTKIEWDQATDFVYGVPKVTPAYDGVEVIAYFQVDDNGMWTNENHYWVKAYYSLKIQYDVAPRNTLYNSGNLEHKYPIDKNNPYKYDPPMDSKLAKNDIDGLDLLFTSNVHGAVYTDEQCNNKVPSTDFSVEETHAGRYYWKLQ